MDYATRGFEKLKQSEFQQAMNFFASGYFQKNDIRCGCYLAQMYYSNNIPPKNDVYDKMAMILWDITARKGKTSSMHRLGIHYQKSNQSEVREKGERYLEDAYKGGHLTSGIVLGLIAYSENKFDKAASIFSKIENLENDPNAYLAYADSLLKKVNPEISKAESMLKYSISEHKKAEAAGLLRELYSGNLGVNIRTNEEAADSFLKVQADMGDAHACLEYALQLYYSSDDENTMKTVFQYLKMADPILSVDGCLAMGWLYSNLYNETKKQYEYYQRAYSIDRNSSQANYCLGLYLYNENRFVEATPYLEAANSLGIEESKRLLFEIYAFDNNKKDIAVSLAEEILSNNNYEDYEPYELLGEAYCFGKFGKSKNINYAITYLKAAADRNSVNAMVWLGYIYLSTKTTQITPQSAEIWLLRADKVGVKDASYYLGLLYVQQLKSADAVKWLSISYKNHNNKKAAEKMAELYEGGYISGRRDKKKAAEWRERAK